MHCKYSDIAPNFVNLHAMKLLRALIFATIFCLLFQRGKAADFANETLHYTVTYKWGLINKAAGTATLSLRNNGSDYNLTLTAQSKPWADKIYRVRDTLRSTVGKNGFIPKLYIKAADEDNKYSLDKITFSHSGGNTSAKLVKTREKKGRLVTSEKSMSAVGSAYDMLSIFYYIRQLDYAAMKPGNRITTTIFSGTKTETLTITFLGRETVRLLNKKVCDAYHVRFSFTTDGGKKSSDDMNAWLSTGPSHEALQLIGKLPVGEVRVLLDN